MLQNRREMEESSFLAIFEKRNELAMWHLRSISGFVGGAHGGFSAVSLGGHRLFLRARELLLRMLLGMCRAIPLYLPHLLLAYGLPAL